MQKLNGELQFQQCNGKWKNCEERTEEFLSRCEKNNSAKNITTRASVIQALNSGKSLRNDPDGWYSNCRVKPAPTPKPKNTIPEKRGQLWEQCDCGNEPVNLPLFLCDECWPK